MGGSIDPTGMRAAGEAAHGVADIVDKAVAELRNAEDDAGGCRLEGFTAGGSLDTFFDTWVPTSTGLSLDLDTTGDKLTSSASTYARDNDAAVDPFEQVRYHRTPSHGMREA